MTMKNNIFTKSLMAACTILLLASCQKMSKPALGDYPRDANPPGGPLNFYAAFDGTTTNPLMNAVDSIRANFASDNPLASIDGVSGKAIQGANNKFVKYAKPNDWAVQAKSFTISCWYKHNGQTKNNAGTNGPEYLMSFPSNNGHWSGSSFLFFLEGDNTACAVKTMIVDKTGADTWPTWEGSYQIAGLMNNQWRHIAIVYNATNSTFTLYIDGVANANTRTWGGHGNINLSDAAISEMRIGAGPGNNTNDDWLSCTWKGGIDQFRMYSTALTSAEVAALYAGRK
jgi:hypothetical protein